MLTTTLVCNSPPLGVRKDRRRSFRGRHSDLRGHLEFHRRLLRWHQIDCSVHNHRTGGAQSLLGPVAADHRDHRGGGRGAAGGKLLSVPYLLAIL